MQMTSPSFVLSRPLPKGLAWLNERLDNKGLLDVGQGKAKGAAARKAAEEARLAAVAEAAAKAADEAALEALDGSSRAAERVAERVALGARLLRQAHHLELQHLIGVRRRRLERAGRRLDRRRLERSMNSDVVLSLNFGRGHDDIQGSIVEQSSKLTC